MFVDVIVVRPVWYVVQKLETGEHSLIETWHQTLLLQSEILFQLVFLEIDKNVQQLFEILWRARRRLGL